MRVSTAVLSAFVMTSPALRSVMSQRPSGSSTMPQGEASPSIRVTARAKVAVTRQSAVTAAVT